MFSMERCCDNHVLKAFSSNETLLQRSRRLPTALFEIKAIEV